MFRISLFLVVLTACFGYQTAWCCNVPVFRYALERWQSDVYELLVLHKTELNAEEKKIISSLRQKTRSNGGNLNLRIKEYDLQKQSDEQLEQLWSRYSIENQKPVALLLYSENAREVPDRIVSVMALSQLNTEWFADSPSRQSVVSKLLSGDSAVWIFVTSGNQKQDDEAYARLEQQIEWNKQHLSLPNQDLLEADEFFNRENPIELKLDFSIVKVDREDPREAHLIDVLMGSESDLEELNEPMAFPVIGRGRVLYALVGRGIYKDTVEMASKFVVGPCSCQVKDQNPGFDLLLNADWDSKIGGKSVSKTTSKKTKPPILIEIPAGK